MHDLIVHDYGPGRLFASVHIEVDATSDILASHELIDDLEVEIKRDLSVELVGHLDPVDTTDKLAESLRKKIADTATKFDEVAGIHDLRIVRGEHRINVIFDVVLSGGCTENCGEITSCLTEALKADDSRYELVITYDMDFSPHA